MSKATDKAMDELHGALAKVLLDGIKLKDETGKPNSALLNVARQFLKDNGVEVSPGTNPGIMDLTDALPFPSPGDEEGMKVH